MAAFYVDEDIPKSLVDALSALGHDLFTVDDDGKANQRISDTDILARAIVLGRAVLTYNRWDFHRLHRLQPAHKGIVTCTNDADRSALAQRIHDAVSAIADLSGQLIKIVRPNRP